MANRITAVFLVTLALAYADTITSRNGARLTGELVSLDSEKVRFRVDAVEHVYSRGDVVGVTFGEPGAIPQAAETAIPPAAGGSSVSLQATPPNLAKEPDLIGAAYLREPSGELIPLERTVAAWRVKHSLVYVFNVWAIQGPKSPVRSKGPKVFFVMRVANGVDPSKFALFKLEAKKDVRESILDPQNKGMMTSVHFNVTRVGASTYGFSPTHDLAPGEYAFAGGDINNIYCIGID